MLEEKVNKMSQRSLHTAAFFMPNFRANSLKKIGLTLSQSRLHTARRIFVRIISFRIRVNLLRISQLPFAVPVEFWPPRAAVAAVVLFSPWRRSTSQSCWSTLLNGSQRSMISNSQTTRTRNTKINYGRILLTSLGARMVGIDRENKCCTIVGRLACC